ncbi:MAG: lipid A biosynthesis acyltransferase [Planctomycetes bacterium]|nr:lipid A biosynthesis acyltransferase [Planctomycetota bacterium]
MSDETWLTQRERGAVWLVALTFRLAILIGRRAMRPLVALVALWYRVFDRRATRASKQWLERVHGRVPGYWEVYRHVRTFAQVTLDRVFLITDRFGGLTFGRTGHQLLAAQAASGRGAVLLGAHLGSFEAMRARGDEEELRIQIVGHFENARMINALLSRLDPGHTANVIHIGSDPVGVMATVKARVEAGDFVAILGDRTGLNERTTTARFFGAPARFPSGPFLLASLLQCPVYLVFGLYHEPNRYELSCEPFAERLDLPRADRAGALQAVVQRYAERLEHHCRLAPDNWFNFFDFWSSGEPTQAT